MKHSELLIEFESDRLGYGKVSVSGTKGFGIVNGVNVIVGKNGSGKTTLGTILAKGRYAYGNRMLFAEPDMQVKMLSFTDIHSLSGMEAQYFAQRMEATMNDMVPTVAEIMGDKTNSEDWTTLCNRLSLHGVEEKKVNYLSSGELRKLLIINALLSHPRLLVLDNPYIGLDAASRNELNAMFRSLREEGTSIALLVCDPDDIPDFTDSVLSLDNCMIKSMLTLEEYRHSYAMPGNGVKSIDVMDFEIPERPDRRQMDYDVAFEIRNGHIRYAGRNILDNIDWKVGRGECWALTGPNGCGKSLLLSMVCADHPQGYANDITLFSRRRGSGESIWDIKDAIGYVSPEMQLFFKSNANVKEILAQGLKDSLHRHSRPTEAELEKADKWLEILGIGSISDRRFSDLSAGEQRLVLVGRAIVGQPELLVLDEPLHGLDSDNKKMVKRLIDKLVSRNGCALIFVTHYPEEIPECVTKTKSLVS